ncbi:PepSY domain-containing protein [Actinomadura sp. LD22]|uniref:PepSY domain-containing protein n=1 Tax=Actinomadura physcomitrii TaxID=2650748 RepID=A0A6I4MPR6_9ACTN|nr:PepSY domain-containing protein [Actinomadura physcomitrii]MWA05857.1 PepSY domain-containing protein [Actinomadura physcomitrii]
MTTNQKPAQARDASPRPVGVPAPREAADSSRGAPLDGSGSGMWSRIRPALLRLHFYAGILIGPFLLVTAFTGLLYTTAPQVESIMYKHELTVTPHGRAVPLAQQVEAGTRAVPGGTLVSVTPGPGRSDSTRVVMDAPGLPEGYSKTAFVNPYNGKVLGTLRTYGEWLPARAWLDGLHRTLHLGDVGRNYSELAASWLWVEVLGGLALWLGAPRTRRRLRRTLLPGDAGRGRRRVLSWHGAVGLWAAIGFLGLSATGLTWSAHAGMSIGAIQDQMGGSTPSVATELPSGSAAAGRDVGIEAVARSARGAGLHGKLVITPPEKPGTAWVVKENTRSWPEHQDSVAVDPATGAVVSKLRFADYPLLAKLTRWGIDAHMGLLFGLANQIVLALLALSLITLLVLGYRMWWLRRPTRAQRPTLGRPPARGAWRRLPGRVLAPVVVVAAVLGYYLPLFGLPLLAFLLVDLAVGALRRRGAVAR